MVIEFSEASSSKWLKLGSNVLHVEITMKKSDQ